MTVFHAFTLAFVIYSHVDEMAAEPGTVTARSCAAAEAYVRAGLQPGQDVMLGRCVAVQPQVAGR